MSINRYSANMKRKIPNLLGAALVVVCMLTATAGERVPFKGQSSGVVTTVGFDPVKGIAYTHVSGTGQATHLGQFTVSGDVAVEVATGIPLGTWTLTAANGDMLFLKMGGHGIDATHGFGAFTVVGGSGRFRVRWVLRADHARHSSGPRRLSPIPTCSRERSPLGSTDTSDTWWVREHSPQHGRMLASGRARASSFSTQRIGQKRQSLISRRAMPSDNSKGHRCRS
jgi:hypothetical protein